jgi:hypothetical protein
VLCGWQSETAVIDGPGVVNTVVAATVLVTVAVCAATEATNRSAAVEYMMEGMISLLFAGYTHNRADG